MSHAYFDHSRLFDMVKGIGHYSRFTLIFGRFSNRASTRQQRARPIAEELRRNEDQLRLIIDTIPTMAWSLRPDGAIEFVNRRWVDYTGISLEEERAEPTRPIHPDDREVAMKEWRAHTTTGEGYEAELRLRRADGVYRWCLIRTVPLRDEQRNIIKWFGTGTEIEDRKQAETALYRSFAQLRALTARLQSVREEERARMAREIHDELGQALTAIKIEVSSLVTDLSPEQQLPFRRDSVMKLIDGTIQTVRRISTELRPGVLDDLGLVAAVEWAAHEFEVRTGTRCDVCLPAADLSLDPEHATALFRILQETLTNVARHAVATTVRVRLADENGDVCLEVGDNGKGISLERLSAASSLGIVGMRERALLLGGELTINGVPGKGTTVRVRIPKIHNGEPQSADSAAKGAPRATA
jgi:PAS domain S-box-containing protein